MALTITIPGAVEATIGATAPAILTVGVGVPGATGATGATGAQGPQGDPGEGVPVGGSAGQVLAKIDGTDYNTTWSSLPDYLTKAGNLNGLTNRATARDNLNLGDANTPTFFGVDIYGSGSNAAHLGAPFLTLIDQTYGQFTIQPSQGIVWPDASVQTTAWNDAPSDGTIYGRQDGSWVEAGGGDYLPLAGGAMDANASITIADTSTGTDSEVAGWGLGVQFSADHTKGTTVEFDGLNVYDGASQVQVTPTGIVFSDASVQSVAYPGDGRPLTDYDFTNVADTKLTGFGMTLTPAVGTYSTASLDYTTLTLESDNSQGGSVAGSYGYTVLGLEGLYNTGETYTDVDGTIVPSGLLGFYLTKSGLTFNTYGTTPASGTVQYLRNQITFGNASVQTIAFPGFNNAALTGNPTAPTPATSDNDTSIATTAYVQAGLLGGTANARNLEVYVRNQSGASIPAGSIVYISGATGNRPLITLSQANNDANSSQTMGFTKTVIANNAFGYVIVRGEVENLNTSALTEGDQLYLSPTVAGGYTTTKPVAPQHLVYVGIVIRSHPTLGTILVAVQNGYELGEIHDVLLTTPANNDLLAYESSTDLWKNKSASTLGLAPLADAALTGNVTITSNSTGAALFIEQAGTGNILTLHDQASDTTFVAIDQNGKINTIASTTDNAGLNIPHGNPPTTPVNGDIWTTTANLVVRLNGTNQSIPGLGLSNTFSGSNTFSAGCTFSAANSTFGNSAAASTINLSTGATTSGSTKAVNVGTGGLAGSTTNIAIGSTTGTSTTTLQGITNGVTQAVTDYSTKLATTAFVTNADMSPSVLPLYISGMTAVNTSGSSSAIANGSNFGAGSTTAGYCLRNAQIPSRGGNTTGGINWTRPVALSARLGAYFQFQTQCIFRMNIGGSTADLATPSTRSIGVSFGASAANTLSALVLEVYNGTSLASVTTSFTPTFAQQFDLLVYSDGAGNVTCYVNGTQVGTSAAGPTTAGIANQNILQLGLLNTSVPTLGSSLAVYNLKYLVN